MRVLFILIVMVLYACKSDQAASADPQQEYYGEKGEPVSTDTTTVQFYGKSEPDTINYEVYDNLAIIEGDIVIGKAEEVNKLKLLGNIAIGRPWPTKTIPYRFSDNLPSNIKKNVQEAIKHWEEKTPLRFVLRTTETAFITFEKGSSPTIGSSDVGHQGKEQQVNLGSSTGRAVAIHEIGHAMGLYHEQSRSDRDQYVTIMWDNIRQRHHFNFRIKGTAHGPYDFKSRMHYSSLTFSRNGKPSIVPVSSSNVISNNGYLSDGDIAAVKALYP